MRMRTRVRNEGYLPVGHTGGKECEVLLDVELLATPHLCCCSSWPALPAARNAVQPTVSQSGPAMVRAHPATLADPAQRSISRDRTGKWGSVR